MVWVGGGSVANLLALWRLHGLDQSFRQAWEAGVVLSGVSAGSICWHVGGTTDSFGPDLRPVTNGLAFLPYSNGVHYDSEAQRRPLYQRLVADGDAAGRLRHRRRDRPAVPRHRDGRDAERGEGQGHLPGHPRRRQGARGADRAAGPARGGLTAMKYVLIYESADDVAQTAPVHFAAHRARWKEFQADGTLLLIGPYSDQSGALAVFTTREAAEVRPQRPVRAERRRPGLVGQGVGRGARRP